MAIGVNSFEINEIDEKDRVQYLLDEVFKSKYVLGRVRTIASDGYGFVTLCAANNVNEIYELDSKRWDIYFNIKTIKEGVIRSLNVGDLIYFKPDINRLKPAHIIQVSGRTVRKLIDYTEFLNEANVPIKSIVIDGNVALDTEEDMKIWATEELYKNFEFVYAKLINDVSSSKLELEALTDKKEHLIKEMELREGEIQAKQDEMEKLANKLSQFGFKSFKENVQDGNVELKYIEDNPAELFKYIKEYIKNNEELVYSDDVIRRFLVALQSKELIILSGPSGTGKTSIVTAFAKAIEAEAKIIPVKPSWTDTEDLIGFYNPIEKAYVATPFLDALVDAKKKENSEKMYLVCLDEMNLAHVEYYFAEFLSKLEVSASTPSIEIYSKEIYKEVLEEIIYTIKTMSGNSINPTGEALAKWCEENEKDYTKEMVDLKKKINFIEKYPAVFEIPDNVRFIGTMNVDQTTKPVSPKVVDRSFVLELLKYKRGNESSNLEKVEQKLVPASMFSVSYKGLSEYANQIIEELEQLNIEYLEDLNSDFNNRTVKHVRKYIENLEKYELGLDKELILGDLIAMKILPRINTSFKNKNDVKYLKWKEFSSLFSLESYNDVKVKLDKMDKVSDEDHILSFWGVY